MKKTILILIGSLLYCSTDNPTTGNQTELTKESIKGMWYAAQEHYIYEKKLDGVIVDSENEMNNIPIDSTDVLLFGETLCLQYSPSYSQNCYSYDTIPLTISDGKLNSTFFENEEIIGPDSKGVYSSHSNHTYLAEGILINVQIDVHKQPNEEWYSLDTIRLYRYNASLPHPSWPPQVCPSVPKKKIQIRNREKFSAGCLYEW
jgi:hypothetical protein